MAVYKISVAYSDTSKIITVMEYHNGSYQVYADNWYCGLLIKGDLGWFGSLHKSCELTTGDIYEIGDIIDRNDRT